MNDQGDLFDFEARHTDPGTAHKGVKRIGALYPKRRAQILALHFPTRGLNYRQIAQQTDIYPTTCSRVLTTMHRDGSIAIVGKDKTGQLYLPMVDK